MSQSAHPPWQDRIEKLAEPALTKDEPFDPLRLCIYATVALIGWLAGPFALLLFATLGFLGYWKARRAGLMRSKCYLRDTRLVLLYLGLLAAAAVTGIVLTVKGWLL